MQLTDISQTKYSTEHFQTSWSVSVTCGEKVSQVKCESKVGPVHVLKVYYGSRGTAPFIRNPSNRWRPQPFYTQEINPLPLE
jgi:hypothetical protein